MVFSFTKATYLLFFEVLEEEFELSGADGDLDIEVDEYNMNHPHKSSGCGCGCDSHKLRY